MQIPGLKRTRSQTKTYEASKRARIALKELPFSTTATTLTAPPSQSIDELNAKYNRVDHTLHSLHDLFKVIVTVLFPDLQLFNLSDSVTQERVETISLRHILNIVFNRA